MPPKFVVEENGHGGWRLIRRGSSGHYAKNVRTRERAEEIYAEWEANGRCGECGDVLNAEWTEPERSRILEEQVCFWCIRWLDYVKERDLPDHAVIDGDHYIVAPEYEEGFRGFGGRRFTIQFEDGREVETTNLWTQGSVPEHFRDRLPDNAEFVRETE